MFSTFCKHKSSSLENFVTRFHCDDWLCILEYLFVIADYFFTSLPITRFFNYSSFECIFFFTCSILGHTSSRSSVTQYLSLSHSVHPYHYNPPMRNDVFNMSRAWDKEKFWVPDRIRTYDLPVGSSNHWATKDSWLARPYTRFDHVWHGSCVLRGSVLSNRHVCNIWRNMLNFKLDEEIRNDVFNISPAWDKEKMWFPERIWTYDLSYTGQML